MQPQQPSRRQLLASLFALLGAWLVPAKTAAPAPVPQPALDTSGLQDAPGVITTSIYDARGRLVSVESPVRTTTFVYDALPYRVSKGPAMPPPDGGPPS